MDDLVAAVAAFWLTCSDAAVRAHWIPSQAAVLFAYRAAAEQMQAAA